MTNIKQKLLALVMVLFVGAGVFAQKGRGGRGDDKRPPKPDTKVVVREKEKPPPNNQRENRGNRDGKKGRP